MSTNIKILQDLDNNIFYPKTHTQAIIDNNSTTLEDRLEGIEGNILPSGGTNGLILEKDNTLSTGAKWANRTQISVGTTITGEPGTNANVTNSGTAANPVLDFTIPKGADAVNPFKGYYPTGVSKPATGAVSDYLYAPPSDSQSTATATIWHYDSTQTPSPWTDTGIDVSAVVGVEFGSRQSVTATKIKNAAGDEVTGPADVLSAEAGENIGNAVFEAKSVREFITPIITPNSYINNQGVITPTETTWKVGKFEIPAGVVKIFVTGNNNNPNETSSDRPLMVELDEDNNVITGCIHVEDETKLYTDEEYTLNSSTKYVLVGRSGSLNPEVKYDTVVKVASFYTKEQIGNIAELNQRYENIVNGINSLTESTAISDTLNDGETIAQIGENEIKIPECVKKYQGVGYAGKVLQVGEDGKITLGDGTGSPQDTTMCVSRKDSKIVHLGPDLLNGTTGSGNGWTYSDGKYTHTPGNTEPLVFNVPTVNDTYYIVKIRKSDSLVEEGLMVSVGDGELCDCYNGTDNFTIGVKSEDGGYLKITPKTGVFSGSITLVELYQVLQSSDVQETLTLYNIDANTMSENLSGWYNIAIGGDDALASNINGSRNLAIGMHSLNSLKSGERNVGLGTFTMKNMVWGVRNIAIGADALMYVTQAEDNVAIGKGTFDNSSAADNYGDSPKRNVAIGSGSMQTNKENAADNVCIGYRAGRSANLKNVCIGSNAGYTATQQNVYIGYRAGFRSTGDNNVIIGANRNTSVDKNIGNCVFVGCLSAQQVLDASGISNSIAIGYNVKVEANNTCVIGNTDITTFKLGPYTLVFDSATQTVKFTT